MGYAAATAYYKENNSWLDSPEDAYDFLYGSDLDFPEKKSDTRKCPLCGRKLKSKAGVIAHLKSGHHKKEKAERALVGLSQ